MTKTLSTEAKRVADTLDEIAGYNHTISYLEYEICDTNPEDPEVLRDEMKSLQNKVNEMINNLKDEGIEVNYDCPLTQAKKNNHLWLEAREGEDGHDWIEYVDSETATIETLKPDFWLKDWK